MLLLALQFLGPAMFCAREARGQMTRARVQAPASGSPIVPLSVPDAATTASLALPSRIPAGMMLPTLDAAPLVLPKSPANAHGTRKDPARASAPAPVLPPASVAASPEHPAPPSASPSMEDARGEDVRSAVVRIGRTAAHAMRPAGLPQENGASEASRASAEASFAALLGEKIIPAAEGVGEPTPAPAAKGSMQEAIDFIREHDDFLVLAHARPDGDAIGSTLGMTALLKKLGKRVQAYNADRIPEAFRFLPGSDAVAHDPRDLPHVGAVIVVDCGDEKLFGPAIAPSLLGKPVLNLDHHQVNTGFGNAHWVQPFSSAAEMIVRMLPALGIEPEPSIALPLYLGIFTDSGGFRYQNTAGDTLRAAARMLDAGVHPDDVAGRLDSQNSPGHIRLLSAMLATTEYNDDASRADAVLTSSKRKAGEESDVHGAVAVALTNMLSVRTVRVAIVFSRRADGLWEAQLRSKGTLDVGRIAERFGGGGHKNAAACRKKLPLKEFRKQIREAVDRLIAEGKSDA